MKRVRSLPIFAVCLVAGGLACSAAVAAALLRSHPQAYTLLASGAGLFILAAAAGVLGVVVFRRNCNSLRRSVSAMTATSQLQPIRRSEGDLLPLVSALNELIDYSQHVVSDASLRLKEMEIQLKVAHAQRQHAQAIVRSISDAVLVTDKFDELVLANEAAAKVLDFDHARASRTPIAQLVRDEKIVELIRDMRTGGGANSRRIVEHRTRQGGAERTYKLTLSTIVDSMGSSPDTTGVICVLHDISKEREVAQMKNDFVSHVSHELRTPLASIKAYVEMLVDGEATDEKTRREFYEIIQAESNRLGRLIDSILNISRIESGLIKVNKQPHSLSVIMKQAIEVIAPQARTKNITLDERILPAFHQIMADKDMLYQAVLNLLSNAVKYTPEGGRVTVETVVDESAKRVTARVADNGVGIPARDLPFVFEKFFRVESNSAMAKGTGLGLALVKNIIEGVHQGRVSVTSEVGKGTTFCFELELL